MGRRPEGGDTPKPAREAKAGQEEASALRRRLAEERLRDATDAHPARPTPQEVEELIHELQVHQIQLEMQNEELLASQLRAEAATERYRNLYESIPLAYLTVDPHGRILESNPAGSQLLRVRRPSLVGRNLSDFVAPSDQDLWFRLRRNIRKARGPRSFELRLERGGGTLLAQVVASANAAGEDAPEAIHLALLDVTELRAAERALRAAASQAALAEQEERRRLAVDLHDDLGQTLSLASLKLQHVANANEEQRERALEEVSRMVGDAREAITSLSFQLSPPILYDVGLIAAAEWLAEDMERRYGLVVTILRAEEPAMGEAARVTLYRALRELLINVAKHSGVHEAHVRIWAEEPFSCMEVTDGGKGFDPRDARRGFGLLALRERVHHLGGTVEISSAHGSGARVLICVPSAGTGAADIPESPR